MIGRKGRTAAWTLGVGAAAVVLTAVSLTASAAAAPSTFDAHYNRNAQLEAQLLQKAQAEGGSSTTIAALNNATQMLTAQVSVLYTAEQALAAAKPTMPTRSADRGQSAKWVAQRNTLSHDIAHAKATMKTYKKAKDAVAKRKLMLQIETWLAELRQIHFDMSHTSANHGFWKTHPFDGGLTGLQQSILDLQQAAIHYTEAWIVAAKPSASMGNPASISGLAYASTTIPVPAAGSAAATDAVAVMPIVKDAQSNVLTDAGTFALTGPTGASGVFVDTTTGEVSVNPGATAGTYVVTYTQGGISQTVTIVVSQ